MTKGRELLIGDIFSNAAVAVPDRIAAVVGERSLTFAALESAANRIARHLAHEGVGRGTHVALWCGTDLDAVPLFAALAKLGALFIPVSGLLGPDEAGGILATALPDLLVSDRPRQPPSGAPRLALLGELLQSASEGDNTPVEVSGLTELDPQVAFFTSGSTGRPKGAVLSHRANRLRSQPGRSARTPRGDGVPIPPLPHGCLDHRAPAVAGAGRGCLHRRERGRGDLRAGRTPPGNPSELCPGGVGPNPQPCGRRACKPACHPPVRRHRDIRHPS